MLKPPPLPPPLKQQKHHLVTPGRLGALYEASGAQTKLPSLLATISMTNPFLWVMFYLDTLKILEQYLVSSTFLFTFIVYMHTNDPEKVFKQVENFSRVPLV